MRQLFYSYGIVDGVERGTVREVVDQAWVGMPWCGMEGGLIGRKADLGWGWHVPWVQNLEKVVEQK